MSPIAILLGYFFSNPWTSSAGIGLILTNLGPLLTLLGSGASIATVIADPHFNGLLAGLGALSAKDMNVTGGRKSQ